MPAMPATETSAALASSADAWNSSLIRRSSRSRPTKGASSPGAAGPPSAPATTRSARQSWTRLGLALQLVRARVLVDHRRLRRAPVASPTSTAPGCGDRLHPRGRVDDVAGDHALTRRAERHGRFAGQHARARVQVGAPTSAPSAKTAATRSSAARTARSASSSVATGVPQTAITASPMNFSTVPP